jgi:hypothetical protein
VRFDFVICNIDDSRALVRSPSIHHSVRAFAFFHSLRDRDKDTNKTDRDRVRETRLRVSYFFSGFLFIVSNLSTIQANAMGV